MVILARGDCFAFTKLSPRTARLYAHRLGTRQQDKQIYRPPDQRAIARVYHRITSAIAKRSGLVTCQGKMILGRVSGCSSRRVRNEAHYEQDQKNKEADLGYFSGSESHPSETQDTRD